jgi:putative aldouronate transport system substrate-binding protein
VDKPLELTAMIGDGGALRPKLDTTDVLKWFADQTNLRISPQKITNPDQASVLFASREFPDFYMSGGNATLLTAAIQDGDILPLDDLLREYAPTWWAFINSNPVVRNAISLNGKIYFLPFINWSPADRDIRDQWLITQTWLDELGLKMPTTTEEFRTVLRAFKNNAGKGSIPQGVIPWYYYFDSYIGGQFDLYSSFGLTITDANYLSVENSRVIFQATNPDLKAPLKYLQELYREGLTPPEAFTDDWNTYIMKMSSNPPIVGSYGSYANRVPSAQSPMPPLQSPNGKKPVMRRQAYVANNPYMFAIFADCKDPVALIKFVEFIAFDIEANMTSTRGLKDVFWRFRSDGKVEQLFWEESPDKMTANAQQMGFWNSFLGLWDANFFSKLYYDVDIDVKNSRGWAYEYVYKNYLGPEGSVYISANLSADETTLMNSYGTDLTNERKETFARWITTNANIDAEWDAYVTRMNRLHINEFVMLKQKAYDLLAK